MVRIDVVTIFPEMFEPVFKTSILKRAQEHGHVHIEVHNLRDYTHDKRRTVDDRPYGGGPGMVMKPEPLVEAVEAIEGRAHPEGRAREPERCRRVLMSPQGQRLTQPFAKGLAAVEHLVVLCGHYEGVDERVRMALNAEELSIGDYVLTGGELPAMVLIDCLSRHIPGVLGHQDATLEESFSEGLLEYPHYTRPAVFRQMQVPAILRAGNHREIATWRRLKAFARTVRTRADLLTRHRRHTEGRASSDARHVLAGKEGTGSVSRM